jgi:oligopeptide/dipeptide ABC transporter ATP-binding protein
MPPSPLVEAVDLGRSFRMGGLFEKHHSIAAVSGVNLAIARGETIALVGESGCGKSTLGRLLLGIEAPNAGHVLFDGRDLGALSDRERARLRARMQLVFQNTLAALDPRMAIGRQIAEPFAIHGRYMAGQKISLDRLMSDVGLGAALADRFPHQLSGGQRQRAVIARALATMPDFVVFDEPVSALDVSVQAQIIALIRNLQRERGFASVFISHDLRVVRHIADHIAVMYLGRIVESGPTADVLSAPAHPYTRALVAAVPRLAYAAVSDKTRARNRLSGEPPNPAAIPDGCPFHPRCPMAENRCHSERPALDIVTTGRAAACHFAAASPPGQPQSLPEPVRLS